MTIETARHPFDPFRLASGQGMNPSQSALRFRYQFLWFNIVAGVVLAIVFAGNPGIDLQVMDAIRHICTPTGERPRWCTAAQVQPARHAFIGFSVVVVLAAVVAFLRGLHLGCAKTGTLGLNRESGLFIMACFAIGIGLMANAIVKDHSGRARPRDVVEYGGKKPFTPALTPAQNCRANCSFVSGEAAAVYTPFFAAALLVPALGWPIVGAGVAAGLAAGFVRMMSGAHFLSDVLFAGVLTALTILTLFHLLLGAWRPWLDRYLRAFAAAIRALVARVGT